MKNVIVITAAALVAICSATAASAGTPSPQCDAKVKDATTLYGLCASTHNSCDEWQVSRLITLTATIATCAKAGHEDAKLFLEFMSNHADSPYGVK